ncbi:unnamed protein product [Lactuca saligna]|uniref:FAS1 domain-containing protein n=1 Tax=Lactuca saligna TaxID=75948 RepID=A0AA35YHV6_LACSI|nr:unnamed protein product [Lactuca saligna]
MDTYVKLYLSTLIMALSLIISSVFASPSANNDIVVAIQEMERANYFTFVMLINMVPPSMFQGNITFLMPSDRSLSRTKIPQNSVIDLLLNHSIPSPLLFDHLIHLPTNSTLPTSNPDLMLKVSNSGRRGLFLGNVRIVSPNICTHGYLVRCHGIDDVLSVDIEKPEITCPRVSSPIPATTPLLAPTSQAPASNPPHADAYETSGGRRPHIELTLTCIVFMWLFSNLVRTTMANFNMNTMSGFSHRLGSSTKIPMLIPEYYEQWAGRMVDYLIGIDEDLWRCIKSNKFCPSMLSDVGSDGSSIDVTTQTNKFKTNDKRCMCEL